MHSLEDGVSKRKAETGRLARQLVCRTREALAQSRQLAHELRPVPEEASGIVDALRQMAKEKSSASGVPCSVQCSDDLTIADHTLATELFHIAREALVNALRHGAPRRVVVRLKVKDGMLLLEIKDNGSGFDAANPTIKGLGLKCMQYRASILGGVLRISSRPGKGTTIVCSAPVPDARGSSPDNKD